MRKNERKCNSNIFGLSNWEDGVVLFEKGKMKRNRFDSADEFNFEHVKFEIMQTYPSGKVSRD